MLLPIDAIRAELQAIEQWNAQFPVDSESPPDDQIGLVARRIRRDELRAKLREIAARN
jgi:hypothetical protein